MLNDQRRKRGRQALAAVARAPPTMRRPNAPLAPPPPPPAPQVQTGRSADSRILAALPQFSDAQRPPHYPRQQQPLWTRRSAVATVVLPSATVALSTVDATLDTGDSTTLAALHPTPATDHVDVRKLIRHAHRAHKLLLDRLTVVNMRRSHRCELADEIARLKRVLAALQAQVDTTTRNVAAMDRLVQHLQQISSIFHDGTTEQRRPERITSADSEAQAEDADTPPTSSSSSSGADTADTTCALDTSCLNPTESSRSVETDQGRPRDDSESTASGSSSSDVSAPSFADAPDLSGLAETSTSSMSHRTRGNEDATAAAS